MGCFWATLKIGFSTHSEICSMTKMHLLRVPDSALDSGTLLGTAIGALRYDQQPLIFRALAKELKREIEGDTKRGRVKLATLLLRAQAQAEMLAETYGEILALSRPYMKEEFAITPESKE